MLAGDKRPQHMLPALRIITRITLRLLRVKHLPPRKGLKREAAVVKDRDSYEVLALV